MKVESKLPPRITLVLFLRLNEVLRIITRAHQQAVVESFIHDVLMHPVSIGKDRVVNGYMLALDPPQELAETGLHCNMRTPT